MAWFRKQDFGPIENLVRDELLARLEHYRRQIDVLDGHIEQMLQAFPQAQALTAIYGIGLYSALLIVAELGEVDRFRSAKQVGAYAGLTSRVHQSGGHCYQGSITRQGSPWLRWILVEAALSSSWCRPSRSAGRRWSLDAPPDGKRVRTENGTENGSERFWKDGQGKIVLTPFLLQESDSVWLLGITGRVTGSQAV